VVPRACGIGGLNLGYFLLPDYILVTLGLVLTFVVSALSRYALIRLNRVIAGRIFLSAVAASRRCLALGSYMAIFLIAKALP
jgi:hypothetical protein